MPGVLNGFGTWHWGKRNEFIERGTCEHCGKTGDLSSFDTRLCFVALFFPLIPLKVERVLRKCPSCRRFGAMPYKEWVEQRDTGLKAAIDKLKANPSDNKAATEAIGLTMAFQYEAAFNRLLPMVQAPFHNNADVQMALGAAMGFFNREAEAEPFLRQAQRLRDDADTRTALASNLIRNGKPDEAAPLLDYLYTTPDPQYAGYLYLLAEGYEAVGQHDQALRQYERLQQTYPDLTDGDKAFKKALKRAGKNAGKSRSIVSPNLAKPKRRGAAKPTFSFHVPKFSGLALVFLVFGLIIYGNISSGLNRKLYVVNGLDVPYTVSIEDERRKIPPYGHAVFHIAEGEQTFTVEGEGVSIPPGKFHWETDFSTRFLDTDTYVLNPDRVAILYKESVEYADNAIPVEQRADPKYKFFTGKLFSQYAGIDFAFRELPDEIKLPKNSDRAWRDRLAIYPLDSLGEAYELLEEEGKDPIPFLQNLLAAQPGRSDVLAALQALLPGEDFARLLKPRLDERPIAVNYHRYYQSYLEGTKPAEEVIAEYEALLAEDPADPARQYLLGRVQTDPDRAMELFKQAAAAENASAWAFGAIAYHYMVRGEYAQALPWIEKAYERMPDEAYDNLVEIKAGLKDWDWLLKESEQALKADPVSLSNAGNVVFYLTLLGRSGEVEGVVQHYLKVNRNDLTPDYVELAKTFLASQQAYAEGDRKRYAELVGSIDSPGWRFKAQLTEDHLEKALAELQEAESDALEMNLLVYALAKKAGNGDLADTAEREFNRMLSEDDPKVLAFRKLVLGAQPPTVEEVVNAEFMPSTKQYIVLELMARFPDQRDTFLPLAEKYCYWRTFPYLNVQELIGAK